MSEPVVITCAVAGGIDTGNPHQPHTRDQVIDAVLGAAAAGAAVVHVHARTEAGGISQEPGDFAEIAQRVRATGSDVVLNFTTGGSLTMPPQERRRSLQAQPEIASLNCGSLNFGGDGAVFLNPPALIEELAGEMARLGVVPEYECFDFGMAVTAARMARARADAGAASGIMHLVLGVLGGAPASVDSVSMFARMVPAGVPWMVTGIGRHNFPLMATTIALGGHVRTGLEDVVHSAPGRYAGSNAELVARSVALCEAIGRPAATAAQARELFGVPSVGASF